MRLVMTTSIRFHIIRERGGKHRSPISIVDKKSIEIGRSKRRSEYPAALKRFIFFRFFSRRPAKSFDDLFVIVGNMRKDTITAILDTVGQYPEIAAAVGQIERTIAEKAIHIFKFVTRVIFAGSIFKILIAHISSDPKLKQFPSLL